MRTLAKEVKTKFRNTLAVTLVFWFLILSLVPLSILAYVSFSTGSESLEKVALHELEHPSESSAKFIKNWFSYRKTDILNWSQIESNVDLLTTLSHEFKSTSKSTDDFIKSSTYGELVSAKQDDLLRLVKQYDYVYDLFLIDKEGNILYSVAKERDLGTNLVDGLYKSTKFAQAYRKTLQDGNIHFSDMEFYEPSKKMITGFLTAPIVDKMGETVGVFATQIRLGRIFDILKGYNNDDTHDDTHDDRNSIVNYLVGADGLLRSRLTKNEKILNFKVDTEQFNLWFKEHASDGKYESDMDEIIVNYLGPLGERVVGLHKHIDIMGVKWVLITERSEKSIHASAYDQALVILDFLLITMLIVIGVALLITRSITKPIRILSDATSKFSQGNRDRIIDVKNKGEIGQLASAFNTMIESLHIHETELKKQTEQAQEAVKLKSEFLAGMSHEIRTPMNGVIGMLNLLMNTKLDETQKHQASIAQNSAMALLSLINDILDFSKIEAGKMDLECIDFNIRNELGSFAEAVSFRAEEKDVELILDVTNIDYNIINADPGRIRQVISNVVGNSIKFTEKGHVLIKASLNVVDNENARLVIEVSDTGIGISQENIENLFESFTQADASTTRKYGGTGLGLAIVKKLCDLMDGSISVESELGHGSKFTIDLGVKLGKESVVSIPSVQIRGKKVLIVDDNALNIEVLQGQLEHWGMVVSSAKDARNALEICNKWIANGIEPPFDIVFLDMQMPGMDGEELGSMIRENSRCDDMKLVMMTSIGNRGDAARYAEIGFDAFFPKPTTTSDLFNALNVLIDDIETPDNEKHFITRDYLGTLREKSDILEWPKNTNILLVEDNITNQVVANGMLNHLGLAADVAKNGFEALEMLNSSDKRYSLILMDCQMPVMDGYEATVAIRNAKAGYANTKLPIIAMTANAMKGDREKCLLCGMDDYIAKPFNPEVLRKVLIKWILNDVHSISSGTYKKTSEADEIKEINSDPVVWDEKEALNRVSNSEVILNKIIEVFLADISLQLDTLDHAIKASDIRACELSAHTIKGAASNISAKKLEKISKELEFASKDKNIGILKEGLPKLKNITQEVIDILKKYLRSKEFVNKNIKSISLEDLKSSLYDIKKELKNGTFIDTDSLDIFKVNHEERFINSIESIKNEINRFDTPEALKIIDDLLQNLDTLKEGE